jgi:hypothetical protein
MFETTNQILYIYVESMLQDTSAVSLIHSCGISPILGLDHRQATVTANHTGLFTNSGSIRDSDHLKDTT